MKNLQKMLVIAALFSLFAGNALWSSKGKKILPNKVSVSWYSSLGEIKVEVPIKEYYTTVSDVKDGIIRGLQEIDMRRFKYPFEIALYQKINNDYFLLQGPRKLKNIDFNKGQFIIEPTFLINIVYGKFFKSGRFAQRTPISEVKKATRKLFHEEITKNESISLRDKLGAILSPKTTLGQAGLKELDELYVVKVVPVRVASEQDKIDIKVSVPLGTTVGEFKQKFAKYLMNKKLSLKRKFESSVNYVFEKTNLQNDFGTRLKNEDLLIEGEEDKNSKFYFSH